MKNKSIQEQSSRRGFSLLRSIEEKHSLIIRDLSDNYNAERAYGRFLSNSKISFETMSTTYLPSPPCDLSSRHILLVGDSTEGNFGLGEHKVGLKTLDNGKQGFYLHPVLAIDGDDGGCYGLAAVCEWERNYFISSKEEEILLAKAESEGGAKRRKQVLNTIKTLRRNKTQFVEKEEYRWLSTARSAYERYEGARKITIVCDSETDNYELLANFITMGAGFVIRACHNRRITTGEGGKLREMIEKWEIKGRYEVDLPATDKRSKHKASLSVSWERIKLPKPQKLIDYQAYNETKALASELELTVVRVKENPETVVNGEKPIEWILYTTEEVNTLEDALKIIQIYRWRWVIEQLFRSLKSEGLALEKCEVRTHQALVKFAFLGLIAAANIMSLVQARDGTTQQNITEMFDSHEVELIEALNTTLEGKTQKQKNPHNKTSLAFAAWVIARLGGWKGYQWERPPGPITFLNGLNYFYQIANGFRIAKKQQKAMGNSP